MNTQHLRYALEIEKTGSISQAAANLYMSQPNLSKALRELENSLGLLIFQRSSKGVIPTLKGRQFLLHARAILDQVQAMEALSLPASTQIGFRISMPSSAYLTLALARFLQRLNQDKPKSISFMECNSNEVLAQVESGESPLGIIRCDMAEHEAISHYLHNAGLSSRSLWRYQQRLTVSATHTLARVLQIDGDELADYTCIYNDDMLHPDEEKASRSKIGIQVADRDSQYQLLQRLPDCYMWSAPLPRRLLTDYQLRQRPCEAGPCCQDVLIYRQDYKLSVLDESFISQVLAVRQEICRELDA